MGETDAASERSTERVHATSWSANLEGPEHAADRDRVVREGLAAIDATAPGVHVNLVTHGEHGHPTTYLTDAIEERFGESVSWEYVDQCGCGGHVTRVHVAE